MDFIVHIIKIIDHIDFQVYMGIIMSIIIIRGIIMGITMIIIIRDIAFIIYLILY